MDYSTWILKHSVKPASFAVARAIMVFPQPGGPNSKTPVKYNTLNLTKYLESFKILETIKAS